MFHAGCADGVQDVLMIFQGVRMMHESVLTHVLSGSCCAVAPDDEVVYVYMPFWVHGAQCNSHHYAIPMQVAVLLLWVNEGVGLRWAHE
jgi:hypothetical protein